MRGDASAQIPPFVPEDLTPEQLSEARAKHERLFGWLLALPEFGKGGLLVSRQDAHAMWEQTGIMTEKGVIFGKIGRHPYQPLGRYTADCFAPIAASQVFWNREFAVATDLKTIDGAFEVVQLATSAPDLDPVAMSDAEREIMALSHQELIGALADYERDLPAYQIQVGLWKSQTGSLGREPVHPDEAVFDALKLMAIQNPRLSRYLEEADAKFGQGLQASNQLVESMYAMARRGHTFHRIAHAVTEWIDMKLQDDHLRRVVEGAVLQVPEGQRPGAVHELLRKALCAAQTPEAQQVAIDQVYAASAPNRPMVERLMVEGKTQYEIYQELVAAFVPVFTIATPQETAE